MYTFAVSKVGILFLNICKTFEQSTHQNDITDCILQNMKTLILNSLSMSIQFCMAIVVIWSPTRRLQLNQCHRLKGTYAVYSYRRRINHRGGKTVLLLPAIIPLLRLAANKLNDWDSLRTSLPIKMPHSECIAAAIHDVSKTWSRELEG